MKTNEDESIIGKKGKYMSVINQLERLAKLKESGVLTEEEFRKEKEKILSDGGERNREGRPDSSPEEKTYFESEAIKVTSTRAILGEKTYSMANITSVQIGEIKPSILLPTLIIIFGLCVALIGSAGPIIVGLMIAGAGGLWIYAIDTEYVVKIGSSSGEVDGLKSEKKKLISDTVAAINEAIIKRG